MLNPNSRFLRWVLIADSATCTISGLLIIFGATALQHSLGLPAVLLRYAGISLLPFAAFLVYLASRQRLWPTAVWAVIVLNVLWTVDSFVLILTAWAAPTQLGYGVVSVQALGVAMIAGLEYVGLKRSAHLQMH